MKLIITLPSSIGLGLWFFITGIARTTGTAETIEEEEDDDKGEEEEEDGEVEEHKISLHSERTWELDKVDLV